MATDPCEHCGGFIGTTARGASMSMHKRRDCPAIKRPVWPRIQVRLRADYLAAFERVYQRLAADVAEYGLDAWAHTDWPREDPRMVIQEVTIREQLECLLGRVLRWAQEDGAEEAARPLVDALLRLLPAFTAPTTVTTRRGAMVVMPPRAVAVALERLRPLTPHGAALATPQPEDTSAIARDRRLIAWYAYVLDDPD